MWQATLLELDNIRQSAAGTESIKENVGARVFPSKISQQAQELALEHSANEVWSVHGSFARP